MSILGSSRRHNERSEVTGLLLYKEGNFMQLLEGAPEVVEETMTRILADHRHRNIIILLKQSIQERQFGSWSMAFADTDQLMEELLSQFSLLKAERQGDQVKYQRVAQLLISFPRMFRSAISP